MNLPFFISKRYLFSKKSRNAINIISSISVSVVAVSTAALIIIFSVFNGFDDIIRKMLNAYDPDLKIVPKTGKIFSAETDIFEKIRNMKEVAVFSESIEDNVLVKSNQRQKIAVIKGVSRNFNQINKIDSLIIQGKYSLGTTDRKSGVFGAGVAYFLSVNIDNPEPLTIWIPDRTQENVNDPMKVFNRIALFPSGIVSVDQDFDEQYILTDIDYVRELTGRKSNEVGALEIKVTHGYDIKQVQSKISTFLGQNFIVKNRYEQHSFLFKIMRTEKWAVFVILLFVIIIASFSITGSLTMLIIEKRNDIITFKNMGASKKLIGKIFLFEGWFISISGALLGLILGLLIVFLQQHFKFVRFPESGTFLIDAYPVKLMASDFVMTLGSVVVVGFFIALIPVGLIKRYI
jgi:lipoprotein-releasing system permease protein